MRVAALQFDVRRGAVDDNLAAVERGLEQAARAGVALVVLPEVWSTSFPSEDDDGRIRASEAAVERVRALSRSLELVVAGSTPWSAAPGTRPRNRLRVFAAGEEVLVYDKLHLFSPTAEHEAFSAGDALPPTVATPLGRLSGCICYDLRFGACLRAPFLAEAEILVVPVQWPAPRAAHFSALVCGRAAELQACVVAANRTGVDLVGRRRLALEFGGDSLVVGPDGSPLARGAGEPGLVIAELDLEGLRALRRAVPVRRDDRADVYGTPR